MTRQPASLNCTTLSTGVSGSSGNMTRKALMVSGQFPQASHRLAIQAKRHVSLCDKSRRKLTSASSSRVRWAHLFNARCPGYATVRTPHIFTPTLGVIATQLMQRRNVAISPQGGAMSKRTHSPHALHTDRRARNASPLASSICSVVIGPATVTTGRAVACSKKAFARLNRALQASASSAVCGFVEMMLWAISATALVRNSSRSLGIRPAYPQHGERAVIDQCYRPVDHECVRAA